MSGDLFLLVFSLIMVLAVGGITLAFVLKKKSKPSLGPKSVESEPEAREDQALDLAPEALPPRVEEKSYVSLAEALKPTQSNFWGRIRQTFQGNGAVSSDLEELEEVLYTSDLGPQTVQRLLLGLKENLDSSSMGVDAVRDALRHEILDIFTQVKPQPLRGVEEHKPHVIMVVGVNGAGKTTTIGKLAGQLAEDGRKVLLAAGDTFRAAADAQLKVWTERAQVEVFSPPDVKDPAAVAFDALQKAKSKGFDVVLIDTAGRLHTQKNLMEELKKVKRVLSKVIPEAPHEVLLVLDANSGQNALHQAREFHSALGVTGVALTKMDGTAKGGVAVGVAYELKVPILWIGVGEGLRDLRPFSSEEYVSSIL